MNVGTTPAEVRGIKKLDNGRRMPRLVYGFGVQGPQRSFSGFTLFTIILQIGKMREPTSGLEPLT